MGKALWGKFKKLSQFGIMLQTMLDEAEEPTYPKVDCEVVFPNALTPQDVRFINDFKGFIYIYICIAASFPYTLIKPSQGIETGVCKSRCQLVFPNALTPQDNVS